MIATTPEILQEDRRSKRLMLLSVALNLFFVGVAATLLARSYFAPPSVVTVNIDRSAGARIERIAVTLPPADAEIIRAAYRENAAPLDSARDNFEGRSRGDQAELPCRGPMTPMQLAARWRIPGRNISVLSCCCMTPSRRRREKCPPPAAPNSRNTPQRVLPSEPIVKSADGTQS